MKFTAEIDIPDYLLEESTVRTRFAPSPTGSLHVGSARTALYAWLFARQNNGKFILRIEDTDKAREMEGAIGHIMESLKWLGIEWDEGIDVEGSYGPYIQSDRLPIYHDYALRLVELGHAYPDSRSEEELDELRAVAEREKRPFLIREFRPEEITEWDGTAPLRFRVPEVKRMQWHDMIMGDLSAGEEALDDFILLKSDGFPTYNFAHIVDDIEMQITHVMRGQEFVSSTPKYLSLYEALGAEPPIFATLPPILGETGTKKLSKRDGAKDVLDYRAEGYLPEAMVNFLALLGWHPSGNEEVLGVQDLLALFELERVQKGGAQFDEQKLLHLNREWMRQLSSEEYVERGELSTVSGESGSMLLRVVPLLKERAHTFEEARAMITNELSSLFIVPILSPELLRAKEPPNAPGSTATHLEQLASLLPTVPDSDDPEEIKEALMPYADSIPKEAGGRGAVLWPLRYALSGAERSPDPFTLISLLGTDESLSRIRTALGILG